MEFFINDTIKDVDELMTQPWYLNDYKNDPTVNSIIEAIRAIDVVLSDETLDLDCLGTFITERMDFLYCDMGNRTNGEETFVVINTTGGATFWFRKPKACRYSQPYQFQESKCLPPMGRNRNMVLEKQGQWQ